MVASLRSLLPRLFGGTDEPVKEFIPPEDDGFIPDYSKYISPPRATTVAPQRHVNTSRSSRAGPLIDTQRGRRGVMGGAHLPSPAYTRRPVSTPITIHAVPGRAINIVTGSATGMIINTPTDTRRGRRGVMDDAHLPPPAHTRRPVSRLITIHAFPGVINIVAGSTAGLIINPPIDIRRGRRSVMGGDHLPPPAYTTRVSTSITIHAVSGRAINIITSSTAGLIINPYAYAN